MNYTDYTRIQREQIAFFGAYLQICGFPSQPIFMDKELDYSQIPDVKERFDDFADGKQDKPWIYIWSPEKGSGKTMLAAQSAIRYVGRFRNGPCRLPMRDTADRLEWPHVLFSYVPDYSSKFAIR